MQTRLPYRYCSNFPYKTLSFPHWHKSCDNSQASPNTTFQPFHSTSWAPFVPYPWDKISPRSKSPLGNKGGIIGGYHELSEKQFQVNIVFVFLVEKQKFTRVVETEVKTTVNENTDYGGCETTVKSLDTLLSENLEKTIWHSFELTLLASADVRC